MEHLLHPYLEPLGDFIEDIAQCPQVDKTLWWYRPPLLHAWEWVVWNMFIGSLFCLWLSCAKSGDGSKSKADRRQRTTFDIACGVLSVFFLIIQVVFKLQRGLMDLVWMIMPCHLYTLTLAVVVLSKSKKWSNIILTYMFVFVWAPLSALAFPDSSDFTHPAEVPVQKVHHFFIVLVPLYLVACGRYALVKNHLSMFTFSVASGCFLILDVHLAASYFSCLNINYQMSPPPLPPALTQMMGPFFRFVIFPFLVLLCIICRFGMELLAYLLKQLLLCLGFAYSHPKLKVK
eukprot:GCRY01001013.1.p1 GENE.GCRY01001013.1~~GCRY01001013.1.p1  ORF type:complete len:289 (+),score=35.12 GCRY01001013.1:117-983(+)